MRNQNWGDDMSLLEEQLEEIRKKTAAVGVTPEMASAAPVSGGLLGIEPRSTGQRKLSRKTEQFLARCYWAVIGLRHFCSRDDWVKGSTMELASYYEKMQDAQRQS